MGFGRVGVRVEATTALEARKPLGHTQPEALCLKRDEPVGRLVGGLGFRGMKVCTGMECNSIA